VVADKNDLCQLGSKSTLKGSGVVVFSDGNFTTRRRPFNKNIFANPFLSC
jgi:hypothetical protein